MCERLCVCVCGGHMPVQSKGLSPGEIGVQWDVKVSTEVFMSGDINELLLQCVISCASLSLVLVCVVVWCVHVRVFVFVCVCLKGVASG